jgi:hypothetical protein
MTDRRSTPSCLLLLITLAVLASACGGREDETGTEATDAPGAPAAQEGASADAADERTAADEDDLRMTPEQREALRRYADQRRAAGVVRLEPEAGALAIELPESFPADVPIHPSGSPTRYVGSGKGGSMTTIVVDESPDAALEFYTTALEQEGWVVGVDGLSPELMMLSATKGPRTLGVAIAVEDGDTTVTLIEGLQ